MGTRGGPTLMVLAVALVVCFAVPARAQEGPRAEPVVLGPVRDLATIVRFGTDPPGAWTATCGSNVAYSLTPGRRLPGLPDPVLEACVRRTDPRDREGSHTWFLLARRDIPRVSLPPDLDGVRIVLGSAAEAQWWISPTLTTEAGESFSLVLENTFPAGHLVQWVLPLDRFQTAKHEQLTPEKAHTLRALSIATSSPGTSLLLDRITAYRRERRHGWLDFRTSHPTNNLFQRNDPVSITFKVGGTPLAGAVGFRYEVHDFYGKVTARGSARLPGDPDHTFPVPSPAPGYYEVTASWTDAAGKDLQPDSCIRAEGTVPDGLGTFAVLPRTIAENLARSRKLGADAFFGLHGDFLDLADHVGLTWRFDYTFWAAQEPSKPSRSSGTAPWAQAALGRPPLAPYRFHIRPFALNADVPSWARSATGKAPGFIWEDALAMVRDTVKVEKHLYPHLAHRLYGGLWEVDLNLPQYGPQKPLYTPANVAEAYRRIREAVKAEDPSGMVIGPCSSVIRPDWFEETFKAGVLKSVDGIETHAYADGTYTPEADDLPGRIQRLNALVRRYHGGQSLPIYVTEAGQPGILGSDVVYRSQAERMVRACIILKGEGVRVFLPFYGIDFDRLGYWGFLFNLDVDSPSGPWSTRRTSPKPMVNAVATCVDMLEGAAPRERLRMLEPGVWAYVFERDGATITAVWAPDGSRSVELPARGLSVEVVDMMGRSTGIATKAGTVRVATGEAPVYVVSRTQP